MRSNLALLFCVTMLVAGCASQSLPAGTLILVQVAHIATKDDIGRGVKVDDRTLFVAPFLLKGCALDVESLESGDLAVVRDNVSWTSTVPHSGVGWVFIPKGVVVKLDDFVELELRPGVDNQRCTAIARVRSPSAAGNKCWFVRSQGTGAGAVVGSFADVTRFVAETGGRPPGSASIYCEGLEKEGWRKHPEGPYDAVIWRKTPATH